MILWFEYDLNTMETQNVKRIINKKALQKYCVLLSWSGLDKTLNYRHVGYNDIHKSIMIFT